MVDLENDYEINRAIMEYDYPLGVTMENFANAVFDCQVKESKYSNLKSDFVMLREELSLKVYLLLKRNERDLADEKADELLKKWQSIPDEKQNEKAEAYEAYEEALDARADLDAEADEIEDHIIAQNFPDFVR